MVVNSRPTGNNRGIRLLNVWQPAGSQTVVWVQDMDTMRPLHLVQWGDNVYLPSAEGLRLGIGVYNGSNSWMSYPTYIGGKNLYDNGPSQPDDCTSSDMGEVRPYAKSVMDAFRGRDRQTGGPLTITANGLGLGIGDVAYETDESHCRIHVYERSANSSTVLGIGAGAEKLRENVQTGVRYHRNSELVVALRVESRTNLHEAFRAAYQPNVDWYWPLSSSR